MSVNKSQDYYHPSHYLADVSDKINNLVVGNESNQKQFCRHISKVIRKAEKYGQYLRTEWKKAKEAGLTQYDEKKDGGKWWVDHINDKVGKEGCIYFADKEFLDVHFYMKEKPKPDPLCYLSSMLWGSVGEIYEGLENLDYQFVLLAIIHDAQNWNAGRTRIYFNGLDTSTLSNRLCRALWQHLQSYDNEYHFRDTRRTIDAALFAVKANLTNTKGWRNVLYYLKKVPRWIYILVIFLAALLAIFDYFDLLEPIKEFIKNIFQPK